MASPLGGICRRMHTLKHSFLLGSIRVTFDVSEETEEAMERHERTIELAEKILSGPSFGDLAGIPVKKPCGCSGS